MVQITPLGLPESADLSIHSLHNRLHNRALTSLKNLRVKNKRKKLKSKRCRLHHLYEKKRKMVVPYIRELT